MIPPLRLAPGVLLSLPLNMSYITKSPTPDVSIISGPCYPIESQLTDGELTLQLEA